MIRVRTRVNRTLVCDPTRTEWPALAALFSLRLREPWDPGLLLSKLSELLRKLQHASRVAVVVVVVFIDCITMLWRQQGFLSPLASPLASRARPVYPWLSVGACSPRLVPRVSLRSWRSTGGWTRKKVRALSASLARVNWPEP